MLTERIIRLNDKVRNTEPTIVLYRAGPATTEIYPPSLHDGLPI